jgi:hypothetical protein
LWDGPLGNGTTAGVINSDVGELEAVMKEKAADIQKELDTHQTFESWGREGQELARRLVYLNGELKVSASSARRIAANVDVPTAPDGYAQNCGKVAACRWGKRGCGWRISFRDCSRELAGQTPTGNMQRRAA